MISQLNTFDNFEEAQSFVQDFVKPDFSQGYFTIVIITYQMYLQHDLVSY